jgi:hypothetical protein
MEDVFGIVVIVVSLVAIVVAVIALASSGRTFEQIGRGGLSLGEEGSGGAISRPAGAAPSPIDDAERDAEIRQMLGARNARREARGEAPLDIEEELRALTAPAAADPGLRDEVRQHVEARNARRVARGQEPLDVEAEVERRLGELGSDGG